MLQVTQTAARLPQKVIDTIGLVENSKHLHLIASEEDNDPNLKRFLTKIIETVNRRPLRYIFNVSNSKIASVTMSAKHPEGQKAHLCGMDRVQDISRMSIAKFVQSSDLIEEYESALRAIEGKEKSVLSFFPDLWLVELETTKKSFSS